MSENHRVSAPEGKLGVLLVGLGAVGTTFVAGVHAANHGLGSPVGSLAEMGHLKSEDGRARPTREVVPLTPLTDLVFGAWDIFHDSAYESALNAAVLDKSLLEQLKPELQALQPMPAVFDQNYVKRLSGENVKQGASKSDLAGQLLSDIENFRTTNGLDRCVMIWCGSTEVFMQRSEVHATLEAFERGLKDSSADIAPSMIYAYAALKSGVPFANGAPNLTVDIPALRELSTQKRVPICGKDYKTGQTLMKTILAPGLQARLLGVEGWFSTNILGNRDGEVLDDPDSFKTKEESKLSVLDSIFRPDLYPDLYGDIYHKVRINYYPPRKDNKEGWDNIDIFGWLGYKMQIKVDFLCRDSILAAPLVLDLALFLDLAHRAGLGGIQEWLSFYFKAPTTDGTEPEHDLFVQLSRLQAQLVKLGGASLSAVD